MSEKDEALAALKAARNLCDGAAPLTGIRLVQLKSFIDYAWEQTTLIQELTKKRRAPSPRQEEIPT